MNILKLKVSANECTWVAAKEVEILRVVDSTKVDIAFLGTYDDLAYDQVRVTTSTDKSGEVAKVIAGYVQADGKRVGLLDVAGIDGVASIAAIDVK